MPLKPRTPCRWPLGCARLVSPPGYCPEHARLVRQRLDSRRGSARARGYDAAWERRRARFLADHPVCEDCGAPATDADHDPARRVLIAAGVADPDDERFLHARCHRCHSVKTVRVDGGFGHVPREDAGPHETPNRAHTGPAA